MAHHSKRQPIPLIDRPLRPGTPVILPDGSAAHAAPDRRIGYAWDGTYRTRQDDRVDHGWRREQLIPVVSVEHAEVKP